MLLLENYKAAELISEDALSHILDLPCTLSQFNVPVTADDAIYFVHLCGDRLYIGSRKTLYVYSVSDYTSPIATYPMSGGCYSGMITDNLLILGGMKKLYVLKVTISLI